MFLTGINNYGTTVGWSRKLGDVNRAVIVPAGGTAQIISSPDIGSVMAAAISETGYVVGTANVPLLNYGAPFIYYNGAVTRLPIQGRALDVNKHGHVVGYRNGTGVPDLNDLIDPLSGVRLERARSINNAGQILATGYESGGESTHFFLLTPGTCDAGGQSLALRRGISALTTENPKLTIVEPCGLTTLLIDATPSMSLFNARAEVTGLTPDPTPLSFDWVAEFKYPTRQKKPFNLNPSFVATAVGGFGPTPSTFFLSGTPALELAQERHGWRGLVQHG